MRTAPTPQQATGESEDEAGRELEDALHALAQPLTALSFALDIALLRSAPEAWRQGLESGRAECRRAVTILEQLRSAVDLRSTPARRNGVGEIW